MERTFALEVEATIGATGEPIPRRFTLGARAVEVTDIMDRWPGFDHSYVKLRGADGATYILRHDESAGAWHLVQFIRAGLAFG
ncbi:MAG: hypothetical protein ACJ8H8_34925 [Geminicoccaceae bacterium]